MSDIALINPPSPFLADERVFPSLGILKVASVLEERGFSVDVLDLAGVKNSLEVVGRYLAENPDTENIGITATTPQFPQATQIAETIRANSDSRIIIGGAHPTMVGSAEKLDRKTGNDGRGTHAFNQMTKLFDVSVIGDGEEAVFEAMATRERVVYADERSSMFFVQKGTLEDYPFPSRHLIDMDSYHYQIDGKDAQSLIAQLGCPFECSFCGGRNTPSFRIARTRDTESVIDEVDVLVGKYGKRGIMFYDDELNVSNASLTNLLEGLIQYQERNGYDLRFRGFVKAELFTQEQADLMYKAGFRVLLSGVESGDDHILDVMRKHTTPEINSRFVEICHNAGLQAKALMSIGHAGETEQSIKNSVEWVLKTRPDDVDWTIITQYPGSPYFDESVAHQTDTGVWVYTDKRTGEILYSREMDYGKEAGYYKGIPGDYTSYVWTETLGPDDLVRFRDRAEDITRTALGLPPISDLVTKQLETSMGMGAKIPDSILRRSING